MIYTDVMAGPYVRLLLRLPPDLHAKLVTWAEHEDRSLNGQIVHLLRQVAAERKE